MHKLLTLFVIFFISIVSAFAQTVEFTASAPAEVAVGERFRVTFQMNKRPSEFNAPAFQGFRVLSGPSQSSSTSMQIINNRTTVIESYSYSYVLEALQEGSFTIEQARITVEGNTHRSNPVTIQVRASSTPPSQPAPGTQQPQQRPAQQDHASGDDVFIRANVSVNNPYQGQQVIVSYNIYTRVSINQYSIEKLPSFRGLWSENLTQQGQPQTQTQTINGETYRVAEIYRVALFPQRSGEITIEPLETDMVISLPGQRRQSLFDEFFGGSPFDQRRTIRQTVRSNAVTLNVRPIPLQNRPAAFSGMVGSEFEVKASVNHTELNVNDAVNLNISVSGRGNLRMLDRPGFNFPPNLEVFDPNVSDNIRNTTAGVSGTRQYDYVMIPRTGGEFVIPSWDFVYFDPVAERFITRTTPEFTLQVTGNGIAGSGGGAISQEAIRTLATDIRFIRTGAVKLVAIDDYFIGSTLFWILLIIPFVLFTFFIVFWRNHIRLQSNFELMKTRKAEKQARKRLKKARLFMEKKQENEFYDEIFRTLWGYLSDKLSIPVSILNKENVSGAFKAKKVPADLSEAFITNLNDCEFARFAPGQKEDRMADIYAKTFTTITTIEKELKNK
jgi:hypothetical protein